MPRIIQKNSGVTQDCGGSVRGFRTPIPEDERHSQKLEQRIKNSVNGVKVADKQAGMAGM